MTKIMVVDDEPDIREMLNLFLTKEGFDTEIAVNGNDFLDKIDDYNPDIVTLDVMMPGPTTVEILDKLKKKKSHPKIILLTVIKYNDKEKKELFNKGSIVDYVKKPFELDDFIDTIEKHEK